MNSLGLVSTLHDPQGRMSKFLHPVLSLLTKWYGFLAVVATPSTSQQTIEALTRFDVEVNCDGSHYIGVSRRRSLQVGLSHSNLGRFHYCDFDRLVHWTLKHPEELEASVTRRIHETDFLVIGRTARAFQTHPQVQIETETITNRVFSFALGRTMDVTAGSCGMSRVAAERILEFSTEPTNATDTEWPMIIDRLVHPKLNVDYMEVEGLEFETPTFYGEDAYVSGDTSENWLQRVGLCRASIEAVTRIGALSSGKSGG